MYGPTMQCNSKTSYQTFPLSATVPNLCHQHKLSLINHLINDCQFSYMCQGIQNYIVTELTRINYCTKIAWLRQLKCSIRGSSHSNCQLQTQTHHILCWAGCSNEHDTEHFRIKTVPHWWWIQTDFKLLTGLSTYIS